MDPTNTGLAGEYYVLAQLAHRGLIASLTLSKTKGIDILVANQSLHRLYKVEVKTTANPPRTERLFGKDPFYGWMMSQKHERISEPSLYYCFVVLRDLLNLPRLFIVPSRYVAHYVRKEHNKWLSTRKHRVAKTTMRKFRIPVHDPEKFENNWEVFLK